MMYRGIIFEYCGGAKFQVFVKEGEGTYRFLSSTYDWKFLVYSFQSQGILTQSTLVDVYPGHVKDTEVRIKS